MISGANNISFGSLKGNLRLGEKALREFKSEFPYLTSNTMVQTRSSNLESSRFFRPVKEKIFRLDVNASSMVAALRSDLRSLRGLADGDDDFMANMKTLINIYKAGNCTESSAIINYGLSKSNIPSKKMRITVFDKSKERSYSICEKEHAFTIIGLKKDADFLNHKQWGNEAVIVDGWLNMVGKASDMLEYYKTFFKINPLQEKIKLIEIKNIWQG